MAERVFQFRCTVKDSFYANVNAHFTHFRAFLADSKDRNQILDRKAEDKITLAEKTDLELNSWLDLVKHTPRSEYISDLLSAIKDLNEYKVSMKSKSSRKSRHSMKSSTSGSSRSSLETLISVEEKRAA